jgi:hypothetical protein
VLITISLVFGGKVDPYRIALPQLYVTDIAIGMQDVVHANGSVVF